MKKIDNKLSHLNKINVLKKEIIELQKKVYQLENIISVMPGHVYWLDKNNIYLGCNNEQAKSAGLKSRDEIIGKSNYDMLWKHTADQVDKVNNSVMEKGVALEFEELALTKSGEKIFWSKKIPLYDKNKNLTGVLGISFDITERKRMEDALKKAIKSKSEFLDVMSHDLRGPFNNILGAAEITKIYLKNGKPINDVEEYLNIIPSEINRALDLLNNVNFLLELNDGRIKPEIVSVDIVKTIKSIFFDKKISNHVEIKMDAASELPENIHVDISNLYIALKIIINNALRFTEEGHIAVKIYLEDIDINNIIIEINDTGCGMTLEQRKNIFTAFLSDSELTERSHLRKPGLKLVIAKKLVELIGGKFSIESTPAVGTQVKLCVPFKVDGNSKVRKNELIKLIAEDEGADHINDINIPQFSILLVEDDSISLELESLALETLNQKITKATMGKQAVSLANETKFDIIFLDITLPDIDGIEVAVKIREKWGEDSTIVAVTSHALEKDINLFTRYGMMTVIPKPANYNIFEQFLRDYTNALRKIND